uniref:DUF1823 family protein n=1 Tax=Synechococcus sp. CS-1329 TaxID=2847975 RepID=UPI00223BABA8|nr:DUF1823 family protein [Synechococcus sp. CS-1329]
MSASSASSASQPQGAADPQPLSRALLMMILDDRLSDRCVCELIWRRLGYGPQQGEPQQGAIWLAGPSTPPAWAEAFPQAPELIAERPPSVRLTRSIPAEHKQLLKTQLGFAGYRIDELVPRRTRRATAVSWLLADLASRGEELPQEGPLPEPRQATSPADQGG